nr:MAG TPA: hypothetical protein [Caudoviricetes sp.]
MKLVFLSESWCPIVFTSLCDFYTIYYTVHLFHSQYIYVHFLHNIFYVHFLHL